MKIQFKEDTDFAVEITAQVIMLKAVELGVI